MPDMLKTPEQEASILLALKTKLHPARLACSPKFTAYLGYLVQERDWTSPRIVEMVLTSDDHLVVIQAGHGDYLESAEDLRRNIRGMADAGIVTDDEVRYLLRRVEGLRR